MLLYRAQMDGPVAAVLDVACDPVRPAPGCAAGGPPGGTRGGSPGGTQGVTGGGLGGFLAGPVGATEGRVRLTLLCALHPGGEVRRHRGWLRVALPVGTRLQVVGCQVSGAEVLLSLRPLRPSRGEAQRLDDQLRLPFAISAWGTTAIRGLAAAVRVTCRARAGTLRLRGRLHLRLLTGGGACILKIPFWRAFSAPVDEGLQWRVFGGLAAIECRVGPGGQIRGEAVLALTCLGLAGMDGPPPTPKATPVFIRSLNARVEGLAADAIAGGRVVVRGFVVLDVAWVDRRGFSRWTEVEAPFSALLEVPGMAEGDRLEPSAHVERLTRVGHGESSQAVLILSVGLTALRPVLASWQGRSYRVEEVVGQASGSLVLRQALFPGPPAGEDDLPKPVDLWPAVSPPWPELWEDARIRLRVGEGGGGVWGGRLSVELRPPGGEEAHRSSLRLEGITGRGAGGVALALQAAGPDGCRVRAWPLPPARLRLQGGEGTPGSEIVETETPVRLAQHVLAIDTALLLGGPRWQARLAVRLAGGPQVVTVPLTAPGPDARPLVMEIYGSDYGGDWPDGLRVVVQWERLG